MQVNLTSQQIEHYREKGYMVIENLLSVQELKKWSQVINRAIEKRGQNLLPFGRARCAVRDQRIKTTRTLRSTLRSIKRFLYKNKNVIQKKPSTGQGKPQLVQEYANLWEDVPEYRELILDKRIGKMAVELEGISSVRVWTEKVLFKPAWGDPSPWHADVPYSSYDSHHSPTFWIALEDATLRNGCMHYLPGSHKLRGFELPKIDRNLGSHVGTFFQLFPQYKDMESVAVELKAGSCVVHNSLIVHGAGANMTSHTRKAVNITFIPSNVTYNGKKTYYFPQEYWDSLQQGQMFDDKYHPVVYQS
ncbi:phytanoyl-CoA dioxygenase family protein [Candidatus Uabimicrobium amorphum]|uniref:SnoK n=1 Tax=Uabimicrobium amorphum TaxID=2596890 RepID=A0A5S9F0S6_UABAM|nr:phytanoyl-CoA dioxygenase family protein [Candidatus Uabimicrobium amorphum]BBM81668.1 SnoK [Candidatus Uabimicrobium amorphum]